MNQLKLNLLSMIKDIEDIKKESRDLSYYIELRLNKSIINYYKELTSSFNYLLYQKPMKIMKGINKKK